MNTKEVDKTMVITEEYLFNMLYKAVLGEDYDAVKEILGTINTLMTIETMITGKNFVSGIGKEDAEI